MTIVDRLCPECRSAEVAHARAAVAILEDPSTSEADRQIAVEELARAARWLQLPSTWVARP